jgi:hypothetical protein
MKYLFLISLLCCLFLNTAFSQSIPHLEKRGSATQLMVDGKPFLVLGGELHNSSSSSIDYMGPIWAKLAGMNLNTALSAVSWELIEPEEGKFDFTLVDAMLKGARQNKLKLILLWFGSWKNGLSHYAPYWVKKDFARFPRVKLSNGKATETITPLSVEGSKADARAFAALMKHVKEVDSKDHTVIMIQVQNEVGVIGDARDFSATASAEFKKNVPKELMDALQQNKRTLQPTFKKLWENAGSKNSGTWQDVFGKSNAADEAFMAWHYAKYVNAVTKAGKEQYALPMFVNAWIVQPEDKGPGDYPSGGPQSHVHDIWKAGAPAIDILAPDIYLPDFKGITAMYHHPWNPLFVPESFADSLGASNAFYAIGHYSAIGYSPFGIDNRVAPNSAIPKAYKLLSSFAPEILEAQAKGNIEAVSLNRNDSVQKINIGGYTLEAARRVARRNRDISPIGYAMIINIGKDEFTIAGYNIDISFTPSSPGPEFAGFADVWEGSYENGKWKPGRKLNGDNIMRSYRLADEAANNQTGTVARFDSNEPYVLKIKLYRFE